MYSTTHRYSPKFISFVHYFSYFYFLSKALSDKINNLTAEEGTITKRQAELKKELYGRFGDSINLETWGNLSEKNVVLQLGKNSSIEMKYKFINYKIMILSVLSSVSSSLYFSSFEWVYGGKIRRQKAIWNWKRICQKI